MDRLQRLQIFVAVAETSGFAAAARHLGLSPPVVTRAIAGLEEHLGVRLFQRTTRKVRLTGAGGRYLLDCKRLLGELQDAEAAVAGTQGELRGEFALTASVQFGSLFVAPLLLKFLRQHPAVSLRLLLLDRVVNLIDEGVDIAVRIARLPDSTLTAARVGQMRRVVCASPEYLEANGVPERPRDLLAHRTLMATPERTAAAWVFGDGQRKTPVKPSAQLFVNSTEVAVQGAVAGNGLTRVLYYMVAADLRAGRLKLVLEDYEPAPLPIHVVHREGRSAPGRVRACVDYLVEHLRRDPAVNPLAARKRR